MNKFRDAAALGFYLEVKYPDAVIEITYNSDRQYYIVTMTLHSMEFDFTGGENDKEMEQFIESAIKPKGEVH